MAQPPSPEQRIDAPVLTASSASTPDRGEIAPADAAAPQPAGVRRRRGGRAGRGHRLLRLRQQSPRRGDTQQRPGHGDRPAGRRTDALLPAARPAVPRTRRCGGGRPRRLRGRHRGRAVRLSRAGRDRPCRGVQLCRSRGQLPVRAAQRARRLRHQDDRPPQRRPSRDLGPARRRRHGGLDRGGPGRHLRSAHAALVPGRGADAEAVLDRYLPVLHAAEARHHLLDPPLRRRRQVADRAGHRHRACHALRLPEAAQHRRQRQGVDHRSDRPRRCLSQRQLAAGRQSQRQGADAR